MNTELINALAALAWPVIVAVLIIILVPTLLPVVKKIIRERSFSIKYGGMEITVQDASDQLKRQVEDLQNNIRQLKAHVKTGELSSGTDVLQQSVKASEERLNPILWVDDHPEKRAHEISKLQEENYEIFPVKSTDAALAFLKKRTQKPKLVITDMRRREGQIYNRSAGLHLIQAIRSDLNNEVANIPIFVYDSATVVERRSKQVKDAGGNVITDSPIQLFEYIDQGNPDYSTPDHDNMND